MVIKMHNKKNNKEKMKKSNKGKIQKEPNKPSLKQAK
jgi:hypothetical protein